MIETLKMIRSFIVKCALLAVIFVVIAGCKDSRVAALQDENRLLKAEMAQQHQTLNGLLERVSLVEEKMSVPMPQFSVIESKVEVNDKMFNPEINGSFLMVLDGDTVPPVVYLELEITTKAQEKEHYFSQHVIHRFMPGSHPDNRVEFVHPLNLHSIKGKDVTLQVTPLTWYQGYPVKDREQHKTKS